MASPVTERPPQLEEERLPDWSAISQERELGDKPALAGVVFRVAAAVGIAAFLWWRGHHIPALVLLCIMALATVASAIFPSVSRAIERSEGAIQRVAGRGLALVFLGAIQLLVFTPLWLLLRLARRDPLALGQERDQSTFWRPSPERRGRPLYRRPFGYERIPAGAGSGLLPLLRLRAGLGLIALLVLADMGAGAGVDALRDIGKRDTGSNGQATVLLAADVAAGRAEPWRDALSREVAGAGKQQRYHPTLGWFTSAYRGRYVNVVDGVRRSYEPAGAATRDVPQVFFFGGSTMFGVFQRDGHTIPSEIARLAEADGLRVRVVNYGQLAYVNWQEVQLLEQLLTSGSRPDLAVFYDGFNELLSQFGNGPHREPSNVQAREINRRLTGGRQTDDPSAPRAIYDAWADVSLVHRLGRGLGIGAPDQATLEPAFPGNQADRPQRRGRFAASIHERGVDIADRLARSYGFRAANFWQPSIYSKRVMAGEEQLRGNLGADPDAWRRADRAARARLRPPVHDIGDALDGLGSPVMYDFVHTNERGAKAVARAIYRRLKPQLEELSGEGRP